MKSLRMLAALSFSVVAATTMADNTRDCMLEGTVQKQPGTSSGEQNVNVRFHSASKYDQDAKCRIRRGEKLEFKLPPDTRLNEAEAGAPVKYRYRKDSDGTSTTELISVGT